MPTIPFERTTAQVIALDVAASTIVTFTTNANLARIPRSLVAFKPAGTAFTVDNGARLEVRDDDNILLFTLPAAGFLDQSTAQSRYTEAATSGRTFNTTNASYSISCNGGLADGGSTVFFRLTFDEVAVAW